MKSMQDITPPKRPLRPLAEPAAARPAQPLQEHRPRRPQLIDSVYSPANPKRPPQPPPPPLPHRNIPAPSVPQLAAAALRPYQKPIAVVPSQPQATPNAPNA